MEGMLTRALRVRVGQVSTFDAIFPPRVVTDFTALTRHYELRMTIPGTTASPAVWRQNPACFLHCDTPVDTGGVCVEGVSRWPPPQTSRECSERSDA